MRYISQITPKGNSSYSESSFCEANLRAMYLDQANCQNCIECVNCSECVNCKGCTHCVKCHDCVRCYVCEMAHNLNSRIGVIYKPNDMGIHRRPDPFIHNL